MQLRASHINVRQYAIDRLNQLVKEPFSYKADTPEDERKALIKEIEEWYAKKQKELNK